MKIELEIIDQELNRLSRDIASLEQTKKNLELERCMVRYGFKKGDEIKVGGRTYIMEPSEYMPTARMIGKDKLPSKCIRHCYEWDDFKAGKTDNPFNCRPFSFKLKDEDL